MEKELIEISGTVKHITFTSPDREFSIFVIATEDDEITVTGNVGNIEVEEDVTLIGDYIVHSKYGRQFKAEHCRRVLPSTAAGIMRYLASGAIKGISPAIAKKLIEKFGDKTLDIIENHPEKLKEIKDIGVKRAMLIAKSAKEAFGFRLIMEYLSDNDINPRYTARASVALGGDCLDKIKENPYLLCAEGIGLSFQKADALACKNEIPYDSPLRIREGMRYVLKKNLLDGQTCLPFESLRAVTCFELKITYENFNDSYAEHSNDIIEFEKDGFVYNALKEYYFTEEYIAHKILKLCSNGIPAKDQISERKFSAMLEFEELSQGIKFAENQVRAIKSAIDNFAIILTGGPGTGKTTTLRAIINIFEKLGKRVFVTAPTGRAAQRAKEVTGRPTKTIHRLLEIIKTDDDQIHAMRDEFNPLDCDVIVVDEMSMVDSLLMKTLIAAMRKECRLIMVGDSDQLPSVGAGNVLHDFIHSAKIPYIELKEIFRQAQESLIVTNSHRIIKGEFPDLSSKDNDFFFFQRNDIYSVRETTVEMMRRIEKAYDLNILDDIQILTPPRKGPLGSVQMNRRLQEEMNPSSGGENEVPSMLYTFREGDKVMQNQNNYNIKWTAGAAEQGTGIFNGDIGVIKEIDMRKKRISTDFSGRLAVYSYEMLFQLELAYAITVHKSQGCEFDTVIIPLVDGFDALCYRNLLYTAVTRAKSRLIIIGDKYILKRMVDNNRQTLRYTMLKDFLCGEIHDIQKEVKTPEDINVD